MNDASFVGFAETLAELHRDIQRLVQVQRTRPGLVLENLAVDPLHGDEGVSFGFVDLVNGADVGVVQGRR